MCYSSPLNKLLATKKHLKYLIKNVKTAMSIRIVYFTGPHTKVKGNILSVR